MAGQGIVLTIAQMVLGACSALESSDACEAADVARTGNLSQDVLFGLIHQDGTALACICLCLTAPLAMSFALMAIRQHCSYTLYHHTMTPRLAHLLSFAGGFDQVSLHPDSSSGVDSAVLQ